jgi:hypothetical protein
VYHAIKDAESINADPGGVQNPAAPTGDIRELKLCDGEVRLAPQAPQPY